MILDLNSYDKDIIEISGEEIKGIKDFDRSITKLQITQSFIEKDFYKIITDKIQNLGLSNIFPSNGKIGFKGSIENIIFYTIPTIHYLKYIELNISNLVGKSLKITEYSNQGYWTFYHKMTISSSINVKNVQISSIYIDLLIINDIHIGENIFEIRNCKINKLVIKNSNLGKTVFNGVEIGKLEIENATLNDCIFNGVDFESYELSDINGEISTKALKDNYRQLKHVMDKNGNHTEANNFYALEMEQYMKSIGLPNTITFLSLYNNGFSGIDSKNLGEKLILVFGYLINEFGNNIIKNVVVIYLYLFSIITLSFSANSLGLNINDLFPIGLAGGQITTITIIILLIILLSYDTNKISNKTKNLFDKINSKVYGKIGIIFFTIIYMITLSFLKIGNFQGIETIIYLINPFSGLTPNSMSHLLWSEKLGMIIHKVIYGILIYQLIIALKRTTRR